MILFMVHCGYYVDELYESHTNIFVVAEDKMSAKKQVKELEKFKDMRMHVDSILEIKQVGNYQVSLTPAIL